MVTRLTRARTSCDLETRSPKVFFEGRDPQSCRFEVVSIHMITVAPRGGSATPIIGDPGNQELASCRSSLGYGFLPVYYRREMITKGLFLAAIATAITAAWANADDAKPVAPAPSRLEISVTSAGFEPATLSVKKGVLTVLVFTRKTDKTCVKEVVLHVSKTETIKRTLPLDTPVEISATFREAGQLEYACGMNMATGVITVK
jgi:hypothetical protein